MIFKEHYLIYRKVGNYMNKEQAEKNIGEIVCMIVGGNHFI